MTSSKRLFTLSAIGTSEVGTATGTLRLAATNSIDAKDIRIGYSTNDANTGTNLVALGAANTIKANELIVGGNLANGSMTIPAGGSLNLGTNLARTTLAVGKTTTTSPFAFSSSMNLAGSTFNAYLGDVTVGEKTQGGGGGVTGILTAGNGGAINIGAPGNTANFLVGHTSGGNSSSGNVDFSGQTSLNASLNHLYVGTAEAGTSLGNLKLASTNVIDANSIRVGYSTTDGTSGTSFLTFGNSNTITTNELTIGGPIANGSASMPAGGTLNLGTDAKRTALAVGQQATNTNFSSGAFLGLQNSTFNSYLSNLVVAEKTSGGTGSVVASIPGGNAGAINLGAAGKTANFIVGHTSAGGSTNGNVDFSGQSSLTASLDSFLIGTAEGGTAVGQVNLAKINNIDANTIRVGYSTADATSATSSLKFGTTSSVMTNEFTVGGPLARGLANIASGGTLNLGTAGQPTNLYIGRSNLNTNAVSVGIFDMTGGTFNAFLGAAIIGEKTGGGTGTATATFTTGTQGNIVAQTISLGVGSGSGIYNMNGGSLTADSVAKGTGTGEFNWSGGTLHVGTWGTPAIPFNLNNLSAGILSPGHSPGSTNVFGNYNQGSLATFEVELAGLLAGSQFDQLVVSGNAGIAGHLNVSLLGGFHPAYGNEFRILSANHVTGMFDALSLPALGGNLSWKLNYEPTSVTLSVVPEPSNVVLGAIGVLGLFIVARNAKRRLLNEEFAS